MYAPRTLSLFWKGLRATLRQPQPVPTSPGLALVALAMAFGVGVGLPTLLLQDPSNGWGWVAWSIGAVAFVVGNTFTPLLVAQSSQLAERCVLASPQRLAASLCISAAAFFALLAGGLVFHGPHDGLATALVCAMAVQVGLVGALLPIDALRRALQRRAQAKVASTPRSQPHPVAPVPSGPGLVQTFLALCTAPSGHRVLVGNRAALVAGNIFVWLGGAAPLAWLLLDVPLDGLLVRAVCAGGLALAWGLLPCALAVYLAHFVPVRSLSKGPFFAAAAFGFFGVPTLFLWVAQAFSLPHAMGVVAALCMLIGVAPPTVFLFHRMWRSTRTGFQGIQDTGWRSMTAHERLQDAHRRFKRGP